MKQKNHLKKQMVECYLTMLFKPNLDQKTAQLIFWPPFSHINNDHLNSKTTKPLSFTVENFNKFVFLIH